MKNILMAILLLAGVMGHAQADSLYRWVDKEGKVHYGDRPAEDAIGAEQKKFAATTSAGDDDLPYAVRKAKQDYPVTLYVAPNCGDICVQARALLNKRGIPFVEKNLSLKAEIDEFKLKTGANSVPVMTIGKNVISGFEAGQWGSELDIAGYPKTAHYGARPVQPAAATPEAVKPEATGSSEQ